MAIDDQLFRSKLMVLRLLGRGTMIRKRSYMRALYFPVNKGRLRHYPFWIRGGVIQRPSNLSWVQKNPILKGRWRPRKRFYWRVQKYHRPQWFKIVNPPAGPGNDGSLTYVPSAQRKEIKRARGRKRWFLTIRDNRQARRTPPWVYGQAGVRFRVPSDLTWAPQNPLIRRKLKPRKRYFSTYMLGKNKSQLWKVIGWNRDQPLEVPLGGQGIPWADQQRANYKLRGKSKRKRFFLTIRDNRQARRTPPWVYGQAGTRFLEPSNLSWFQQSPLIKRKLRPRKRIFLAIRDSKQNHRRVPHVYGQAGARFLQPSNLSWFQQSPLIKRKLKPRRRFYMRALIYPMNKGRVRHYPFNIKGGFIVRPSNLSWYYQNPQMRGKYHPRKRFKIKGRWPNMVSKMHIIAYWVTPFEAYYPRGPGKTKTRLAKPSLDVSARGAAPRLQK